MTECGFQKKKKQEKYKENKLGVEKILSHIRKTQRTVKFLNTRLKKEHTHIDL